MKLKIAQITPYYHPSIGGVASVAKYISEELVRRGHHVDVITAYRDHKERPKLNAPKFEIINGVNVFRYNSIINISHMSFFPSLIPHLINNNYDVLHFHSYRHPLCDITAIINRFKKSSVTVLHGHGPFFEPGEISSVKQTLYTLYDKYAKKTVLRWSDYVIALNEYEKKRYLQLGVNEEKVIIIPNAADDECFIPVDPLPFIEKYSLHNKSILLFLGIINTSKRPDLLVKAMPHIIKENPEAHLIIAGPDGGMLQTVKTLISDLYLENYITLTGPLYGKEKHQAYCSAKLFLLSSDLDAYPLVLIEAMAHGLPIIATDARGPESIILDGKTGLLTSKGDEIAIAEKVIYLLKNEIETNKFRSESRIRAEHLYRISVIVNKIENIYLDTIKRNYLYV